MGTPVSSGMRARVASVVAVLLVGASLVALAPLPTNALVTKRILVLLCRFEDNLDVPQEKEYYENFFSAVGDGQFGAYDFWTDVTYGNLDLQVTVTDWITVPMTRHYFAGIGEWPPELCAEPGGYDVGKYDGLIVTPNLRAGEGDPPKSNPVSQRLAEDVDEGDTSIEVTSSDGFPDVPFVAHLGGAYVDRVNVTDVDGTTWTVQRDYPFLPRAKQIHTAGDPVVFFTEARYQGDTGIAWLTADTDLSGATHEMVHLLGFNHSRKLSTSTTDYNDCFDIASSNCNVFSGGYNPGGYNPGIAGPGMNAVYLDKGGWLDADRKTDPFDKSTCRSQTYTLAALSDADVPGPAAVLVPAEVTFPNAMDTNGNVTSTTTSSNYYVSFRHQSAWDAGIPASAVVLHLDAADGLSYWVDGAGGDGSLEVGESYVDPATNTYVAVNAIDSNAKTATVTVGSCPIATTLQWTGDTQGDFTDSVTLAANLTANGAPVPNAVVSLALGSQSCPAGTTTDLAGRVECTITLTQQPGVVDAQASYAGDGTYVGTSTTQPFTIEREDTALAYTGATSGTYSDSATVSAALTELDDSSPLAGKAVSFALGPDGCTATTDNAGVASCDLTPTQAAGDYQVTATFAGDAYYLGSSAQTAFTVVRESTVLNLADVEFAGIGDPLTLSSTVAEDDGPPVVGRDVVFTVGGTQSCAGTTDDAGNASCTIPSLSQPMGPTAIEAVFGGDAYYVGSSDQGTVTVFAWTPGGNFVIGDGNAATGTTATFWADDWYLRNTVSGGTAPKSFKGFANMPSGRTTCGGTWSTTGGNSPPPAGSVPEYTAVMVTSKVTKTGTKITGTTPNIAIVRINSGYSPSPGHPGTATVLGIYC